MTRRLNDPRGQNVIEYILLVVAVVVVFIIFLNPQGKYKAAIENKLFDGTVKQLENTRSGIQFNSK